MGRLQGDITVLPEQPPLCHSMDLALLSLENPPAPASVTYKPHKDSCTEAQGQADSAEAESEHPSICDAPTELQEKGQRPTRVKDASTLGEEVRVSVQACSWVVERRAERPGVAGAGLREGGTSHAKERVLMA